MKNRIIYVVLIVILLIMGLFVLTGCGNKENSNKEQSSSVSSQEKDNSPSNSRASNLDKEESVNKLHFNYSSNANIKNSTNGKIIENENYNIIVSHQKDKTVNELENSRKYSSASIDTINNVEWKKYSYNDEQVTSVVYMLEKDNGTYVITISQDAGLNNSLDKEIKDFMNTVRFVE